MIDDPPRLAGRYELGDLLGRGGMAEVRRGVDLKLGRSVAIKLLKTDLAADPGALKRFQREAHAVAILNHPAIAAVYDTGERVDPVSGFAVPYLVMELVEGATLREVLDGEGPLAPDRALEIVGVVLDALEHSHAAGIVHRDIKPSNIMITPSGAIKVMDFGIARAVTETTSGLTGTAMVIGTAAYLSPEQAQGQQVDFRSDLYSTGCLMYELLLGRPAVRRGILDQCGLPACPRDGDTAEPVRPDAPGPSSTRWCSRRWPRIRTRATSPQPRWPLTSTGRRQVSRYAPCRRRCRPSCCRRPRRWRSPIRPA